MKISKSQLGCKIRNKYVFNVNNFFKMVFLPKDAVDNARNIINISLQ